MNYTHIDGLWSLPYCEIRINDLRGGMLHAVKYCSMSPVILFVLCQNVKMSVEYRGYIDEHQWVKAIWEGRPSLVHGHEHKESLSLFGANIRRALLDTMIGRQLAGSKPNKSVLYKLYVCTLCYAVS